MCRFPRKMFLNGREARCRYVRRFGIIVIGGFTLLNPPYKTHSIEITTANSQRNNIILLILIQPPRLSHVHEPPGRLVLS